MDISVITILPDLIKSALADGVVGRAIHAAQINLDVINPRDFTHDVHQSIDDRPFGGGPGMVMKLDPMRKALESIASTSNNPRKRIFLSPTGSKLTQQKAEALAETDGFILICGRYEGVDQRFIDTYVDEELSIGDYVLSGGELASLVVIDTVVRLLPGTLGNAESTTNETFSSTLLSYPQYTRPQQEEQAVPDVLLSGDHHKITTWRRQEALRRTFERRPDLLLSHQWTDEDVETYYEMVNT